MKKMNRGNRLKIINKEKCEKSEEKNDIKTKIKMIVIDKHRTSVH